MENMFKGSTFELAAQRGHGYPIPENVQGQGL